MSKRIIIGFDNIKSVGEFLRSFTAVSTPDGKRYYYVPYWFEEVDDNQFVLHGLDNLPEELKYQLNRVRDKQDDVYYSELGIKLKDD
jgi:hypothetical protein